MPSHGRCSARLHSAYGDVRAISSSICGSAQTRSRSTASSNVGEHLRQPRCASLPKVLFGKTAVKRRAFRPAARQS